MNAVKNVSVVVSGHPVHVPPGLNKGADLRTAAKVPPDKRLYLEVKGEIDVEVGKADLILIKGGEVFSVGNVDLPENPDRVCPIEIKVNRHDLKVHKAKISGREVLGLLGGGSEGSMVTLDIHDLPDEPIAESARLILTHCNSFLVTPRGNVGYEGLSHQLSELKRFHPQTRVEAAGAARMVIVPGIPLRQGWSVPATDVMFLVPQVYPPGQLDMFWVPPGLTLKDGRMPANGDQFEDHGGRKWQRFSWHYTAPWNPVKDSLLTHLDFCGSRLQMLQ